MVFNNRRSKGFTKVNISTFYQKLLYFKAYLIIYLSSRCPVWRHVERVGNCHWFSTEFKYRLCKPYVVSYHCSVLLFVEVISSTFWMDIYTQRFARMILANIWLYRDFNFKLRPSALSFVYIIVSYKNFSSVSQRRKVLES